MRKDYKNKKLIVFDIDGTLTPSKSVMEWDMVKLFLRLLEEKKVAVIGGGKYSLFKEQMLSRLPQNDARLAHLFLFPTTANAFYRYHNGWKNIYTLKLSKQEKLSVRKAFRETLKEIAYVPPKKIYGVVLEDRGTQMSFSPLGQDVVARLGKKGIRAKEEWKKNNNHLRLRIAKLLAKRLPKLEVHVGGLTTIDVTRKGIDKAYGLRQIKKELGIPIRDMLFIGDAIYPSGNDYAVVKTGVDYIKVKDPRDTKKVIRAILGL